MISILFLADGRQARYCRFKLALPALVILANLAFTIHPQAALGVADVDLSEIVVDKPNPGGDIVLGSKTKLSEYGDVSMLMYFEFPSRIPWLYLQDNAFGETSHIELPHYSTSTTIPKVEHVLTGLDEAVTLHSDGSALVVREYQLTGTPLPSSATLVSELSFGNSNSRPRSLIKLSSGALIAVWYQHTANADKSISLGFAYRNPQGEWSSTFPVTIGNASSSITSASISMAQHPGDESIWVFCKRDSFHRIEAVHVSETPGGITVDWIDSEFITENNDGEFGPESERPDLVAVPDPHNNSILLAYQSYNYAFFSLDPFVKGAEVTIAKIAQDGSRSYHTLSTYAERITRLGLVADKDKAWLAYRSIDDVALSFDDLYVDSYDFAAQSWDGPVFLDTLYRDPSYDNRDEAPAYGTGRADFATKMADGYIHFYRLTPVSSDVNTPPLAYDRLFTTQQDAPVDIDLSATDADGDALSYTIVSDPASGTLTGTAPYLTYTPAPGFTGVGSFAFSVNDGQADSNLAVVSITVDESPNLPPLTRVSVDSSSGEAPFTFSVDGSASLDQDGEIVRYDWDFGDGVSMSDGPATTTHRYSAAGTYTVTLSVIDNRGATDTESLRIDVFPVPEPLTAPSALKATVSKSKVTLTWTDNSGIEEEFWVERGISKRDNILFERIAQVDANVTSFVETVRRGKYVYRVKAVNMSMSAPFSEYASSKTVKVQKR